MSQDRTLPRYLYRVFDEETYSKFSHTSGFVASISNAVYYRNHPNARRQLELHMDWSNRRRTPFLSVTASREKALEYALNKVKMGRRIVSIAKIDSSQLKRAGINIYWMRELAEQTGAYLRPEAMNDHEYLCIRNIPAHAVIQCLTLDDGLRPISRRRF
ncbi:hypothetical protein DFJ58DRAFT_775304 [Suillus subalutaceus]|uniref:uncharacterized protein n=1 Tax=Suillus subalutaceus TaxID=48586 RepID=UPI001B8630B6|nr:uncharacterized protein DFJ58DRAFT_775304 [Suillus subalutaceus]KAG1862813.1 hypothetical protein DFJ58DRAFT_775304 [Suillus subalutaceus]